MLDFFQFLSIRKFKLFGNPEDYPCVLADLVNPSALDRVFSQLEKKSRFSIHTFIKWRRKCIEFLYKFSLFFALVFWLGWPLGHFLFRHWKVFQSRWGNATCTWRSKFSQTLFKPSMRRYYKTKGPTPFSKGKLSRNDENGGFLERSSQ